MEWLSLPISKSQSYINNEYYNVLGVGYILWISEETNEINKDISLLLVNHSDFIDSGTESIKNLFAQMWVLLKF